MDVEAEIVRYFEHRVVPRNAGRTNLVQEGADHVVPRSLLLGLFTCRGLGITRATRVHPKLVSLVHALASWRPVELAGLGYWSAMINEVPEGSETPWHSDERNTGVNIVHPLSAGATCAGGALVVDVGPSDGMRTFPWSVGQWIVFNPKHRHTVERTGHRRLSVTYFSPYRLNQVPESVFAEARQLGFGEGRGLPRCMQQDVGEDVGARTVFIAEGEYMSVSCSMPPSSEEQVPVSTKKKRPRRKRTSAGVAPAVGAASVFPGAASAECDPTRTFEDWCNWRPPFISSFWRFHQRIVQIASRSSLPDRHRHHEDLLPMPLPYPSAEVRDVRMLPRSARLRQRQLAKRRRLRWIN
eukprot:4632065-Amphidinium_carterae.2